MSLLIHLPAPQDPPLPAFDVTATLDGVTYTLSFQWQVADTPGTTARGLTRPSWFVRVLDEPGQTVLMGDVRIVADWPLYLSRTVRTPPGLLLASDTSGQGQDPGISDLGARVQLLYATTDDLDALGLNG